MNSIKAKLKEAGRKSAKQITILIIAMTATRNHFSPFPFAGAQAEPFRSIDGSNSSKLPKNHRTKGQQILGKTGTEGYTF